MLDGGSCSVGLHQSDAVVAPAGCGVHLAGANGLGVCSLQVEVRATVCSFQFFVAPIQCTVGLLGRDSIFSRCKRTRRDVFKSRVALQLHIFILWRVGVDASVRRRNPAGHLARLGDAVHQAVDEGFV